jgi:hypothetical protein
MCCSKPEKESKSYTDLTKEVIKNVSSRAPLLSFTAKLLNKLVSERDWAAQEVSHILLNLPLVSSSRDVITIDCRPESFQKDAFEIDEEGLRTSGRTAYVRYKDRMRDIRQKVDSFKTQRSERDGQDYDLDRQREDPGEREKRHEEREQQERDLLKCQKTLSTTTLLEWLKYWDHEKFKIRPRAKPRTIHYYP